MAGRPRSTRPGTATSLTLTYYTLLDTAWPDSPLGCLLPDFFLTSRSEPGGTAVTRPLRPLHAPPNSLQPQRCVRVTKGRLPGHLCGLLWDTEHAWPNYSAGNSSLLGDGKMYVSPPEAARGKFWLFAPFLGEFGPFLTFNNVENNKHWPTLNNVKEFCQRYANVQTQTQRSAALYSLHSWVHI